MKPRTILLAAAGLATVGLSAVRQRRQESAWLRGKTVLITGGSRGLGLALAERFGRGGAKLVLTARDAEELDRAAASLIERGFVTGEDIQVLPCDLTAPALTREMVAMAERRFGQIDVLVNNAGVIEVGPIENQPLHAFKEAIESNYYTALHTTLAVLPGMLERRSGSIVNIASIGGKISIPHLLPYSASKFALVGFSQGLNAELRSKGIQVTTVCPGLMRTGSHVQARFTGDREREYRWFSLGASLPGLAASARSAARKIVQAVVWGRDELTITPQAVLAAKLAQLAPSATAEVLGWVNAVVLPAPTGNDGGTLMAGGAVREKELRPLTALGEAAGRRLNQSGPAE